MVEKVRVDRLDVQIYADRKNLDLAAARAVAQRMRSLLAEREQIRMVFAAAPSQEGFLAQLASLGDLGWDRVTAFQMDEYVGLEADASQSFARFLHDHLYDKVRPGQIHSLNGQVSDLKSECRRYADLVTEAPIDIVCAGIGENGHLAFNDPPVADFNDPETVKLVNLDSRCRKQQVHDGCFSQLDAVPKRALTLTIPALVAASFVYCVVPGPSKAEAVRDALLGSISTSCPATALRRHESAALYLDTQSARLFRSERRFGK